MRKLLTLCIITFTLFACDEEDPIPGIEPGTNQNANSNAALVTTHAVAAVTESAATDLQKAANRMEMPRLQGGPMNLFVVHTVGSVINYAMEYDCTMKASRWTAYQWYDGLSSNSNDSEWNRNSWRGTTWAGKTWNGDPFQEDPLIPEQYRATLQDHVSNGHDRGHMLGSADRLNSMDFNGQTFYLSNMHPQNSGKSGFNQSGIWYNLENHIRNAYDKSAFRDTLYIVKGGTISEGKYTMVRGAGNPLPRPSYFFMALLCKNQLPANGGYKAIAFWMEHKDNTDKNYKKYAITIDELETLTGIDFFCNLPDDIEDQVERTLSTDAWKL